MKMHLATLLVLATTVSPAFAQDKAPEGDLAKLQGDWRAMVGPNKDLPLMLTIKNDDLSLHVTTPQGEDVTLKGKISVNEKTDPKQMDWTEMTAGDREVPDNKAIYKLDGNTLSIRGGRDQNRPENFDDAERVLEFQKVNPEEKDKPEEPKKDDTSKN